MSTSATPTPATPSTAKLRERPNTESHRLNTGTTDKMRSTGNIFLDRSMMIQHISSIYYVL